MLVDGVPEYTTSVGALLRTRVHKTRCVALCICKCARVALTLMRAPRSYDGVDGVDADASSGVCKIDMHAHAYQWPGVQGNEPLLYNV